MLNLVALVTQFLFLFLKFQLATCHPFGSGFLLFPTQGINYAGSSAMHTSTSVFDP
jgi:hypothetical protein